MIIRKHTTLLKGDEVGQIFADAMDLDQIHFLEGFGFAVRIMGKSKWPFQCRHIVEKLKDEFDTDSDVYRNIKTSALPALRDLVDHLEEL